MRVLSLRLAAACNEVVTHAPLVSAPLRQVVIASQPVRQLACLGCVGKDRRDVSIIEVRQRLKRTITIVMSKEIGNPGRHSVIVAQFRLTRDADSRYRLAT